MTRTAIGVAHQQPTPSRARTEYFAFEGGWNIVDPVLELKPGTLLDGENYEVHYSRGYARCDGYERMDGTGLPSKAEYYLLSYTAGATEPAVGDTVTGATSSATGIILAQKTPTTGTFVAGDAAGDMVLGEMSGTFQDGEDLQISAATVAVANGTTSAETEDNDDLHATYSQAAIEKRRALITTVPGSGNVLGAWKYNSDYYAFRANAGGTAVKMYKATTSGWTAQDLGSTLDFDSNSIEVPFDSGSAEPTVGDLITSASSGTGRYRNSVIASGSWAGGDAAGTMVLAARTGAFADNDQLDNTTQSATNIATENGDPQIGHQLFEEETLTGKASGATATVGRVIVQSGDWSTEDAIGYLAIRSVTGTFQSGEALHSSDIRIPFDSGLEEPSVGDTITGATSGATGVIREILPLTSGSWSGSDAAGTLVLKTVTGTFSTTENLDNTTTGTSSIVAVNGNLQDFIGVATTANVAVALVTGGRYGCVNHNFGGATQTRRMYGADGANNAFEWDGTTYVPIRTGMDDDTPLFPLAHKQHLFLAFSGGSLQHSSTAMPLVWDPVTGASELAVGAELTGMSVEVGDVLAVVCRSETYMLYGTTSSDWNLKRFHQGSGGIRYTVQKMVMTWMVDDQGATALQATLSFGDFIQAVMTRHIQPYLAPKLGNIQGTIAISKKAQYRIYFDDMTGITITMSKNKMKGLIKFRLAHQFFDTVSVRDDPAGDGTETEVLLGSGEDGYVYRLDSGTSFDGDTVNAYLLPIYNHERMPSYQKVYRGMLLELSAAGNGSLSVIPEFDYGADTVPTSLELTTSFTGGGGRWNVDNWNQFYWSSPLIDQQRFRLSGAGRNMSPLIISAATYEQPHIIQGLVLEYAQRRLIR